MKKLFKISVALILAVILLVCAAGCANNPGNDPVKDPTNPPAAPTEEPAQPTEDPDPDVKRAEPLDLPYADSFTVSRVFSSNMVIQRNERFRVWGWAEESENGKKISGEFMGLYAEAVVENGEWVMTFGAKLDACADMGNSMRIYTTNTEVEFKDVLVGDVYMVIGQSNCAYGMQTHWDYLTDSEEDSKKCTRNDVDPDMPIRLCYNTQNVTNGIQRGTEEVAKEIKGRNAWKVAKRSVASSFSAIGYLFAWNYVKLTEGKVPVGMIEIDGNGQPLGAFLPNAIAEKYHTDTYNSSKGYYVTTGVNANWGRFLYNEYMYAFERMAMAGVLWYQGESDLSDREANRYASVYVDYMEYMRGTHNLTNRDFAVYFIEFPTQYTKPAGFTGTWAYMDVGKIRGIMGGMVTMANKFYQVQSSDVWADREFWNTLHPNCKYEQALRAAKIACAVNGDGGITMENASGPIIESVEFSKDGKKVMLKYKNVGDGLKTIDGSDTVKGFTGLSAENTLGANLTGTIKGKDTVEITSKTKLAGIAYNVKTSYFFGEDINLCNSAEIPAGSFLLNNPDA
ncbi:MAG: hypothetical protein J6T65_05005 [Clostridia bacterium]|nr:hypothetical protein [Clostridia bacterium]